MLQVWPNSYPVSVDISVHHERQLVFPAVTICNMSPVKKSALQAADLKATAKRRKKRLVSGSFTSFPVSYMDGN